MKSMTLAQRLIRDAKADLTKIHAILARPTPPRFHVVALATTSTSTEEVR